MGTRYPAMRALVPRFLAAAALGVQSLSAAVPSTPVPPAPVPPALALLTPAPPAPAASPSGALWHPPLGYPLRVSAAYSLPDGPYRAGHRGIDLPAVEGLEVRIPATGTVSFVGTVVDRPLISVRVDDRTVLSLEPVTSELQEGDRVVRGEAIGTVASGGHCLAACLHLGVRVDGAYVNPMRFLRARPVLLPW